MRSVRFSKTFDDQLITYIDSGSILFGARVAEEKKARVYAAVRMVAANPGIKRRDPKLGFVLYPVARTPFFIVYDYDESELRVLFIFINGKPPDAIDPHAADWSIDGS